MHVYQLLLLQLKEQNSNGIDRDDKQLKKFIKMWLLPAGFSETASNKKKGKKSIGIPEENASIQENKEVLFDIVKIYVQRSISSW